MERAYSPTVACLLFVGFFAFRPRRKIRHLVVAGEAQAAAEDVLLFLGEKGQDALQCPALTVCRDLLRGEAIELSRMEPVGERETAAHIERVGGIPHKGEDDGIHLSCPLHGYGSAFSQHLSYYTMGKAK